MLVALVEQRRTALERDGFDDRDGKARELLDPARFGAGPVEAGHGSVGCPVRGAAFGNHGVALKGCAGILKRRESDIVAVFDELQAIGVDDGIGTIWAVPRLTCTVTSTVSLVAS